MGVPLNQVIIPSSYQELFGAWNRFPTAVLYAGGTYLLRKPQSIPLAPYTADFPAQEDESQRRDLPPVYLCLDNLPDLQRITRTEHFLDIGSMVKLNILLNLGKIVPKAFKTCLEKIGGFQLRNIATIGGNICNQSRLLDLPAPLTALDAQYELRNSSNVTRWVFASRFHSKENENPDKKELLIRVRLPIHQWDYAIYKKFYDEDHNKTEAVVFLAKTRKNILSEIRVIYKSSSIIRNKKGEDILNGKSLPLNHKTADEFVENWREFLKNRQEESDFSQNTVLNSIRANVYNLSE